MVFISSFTRRHREDLDALIILSYYYFLICKEAQRRPGRADGRRPRDVGHVRERLYERVHDQCMLSPNRYFHFLYLIFKMIKKNRRNITAPFIVWEDDNPQHLIPQVEQSERDHLDVRVSRIEESVERFVDSMRIVFQLTKLSIWALRRSLNVPEF